jgi:hypothetical protein
MSIVAFDAGEFSRWKKREDKKEVIFFTPLGVGVSVKKDDEKQFKTLYHDVCRTLSADFKIPTKRVVYSHSDLWKEVGHFKAIPFCDKMIEKVQELIEHVFFSYVVLPPAERPTVEVGGYNCPLTEMSTMKFLRSLTPMFSYITAWAHSGKHRLDENQYFIDNFSSKQTTAWRDLLEYRSPIIFPRGSECNEFISIADMFAYLTEKKLWDNKLWLRPENIEKVWKDYDFSVETRFIDEAVLSKIRWYSKEEIPTADYLARPMVFMDIEGISVSRLSKDPLASAAAYACSLGGGLEAFDPYIDSDKIRDGDVYVYAGKEAEKRADSFKDMFEIETLSVKELRQKAQQLLK